MPALHIIAAGSLLEFVLKEHSFSMPVGRIEYLHLGPMSFDEFLIAMGREPLRFNSDTPSFHEARTSIAGGNNTAFRLLSLPLYLVGQARRLCRELI